MVAKSLVSSNKSKNFTFRITPDLADQLAEIKDKCAQHGLRVNVTESLTSALEREIKALQKHIQGIEPSWAPGQGQLPLEEQPSVSAKANTKKK